MYQDDNKLYTIYYFSSWDKRRYGEDYSMTMDKWDVDDVFDRDAERNNHAIYSYASKVLGEFDTKREVKDCLRGYSNNESLYYTILIWDNDNKRWIDYLNFE